MRIREWVVAIGLGLAACHPGPRSTPSPTGGANQKPFTAQKIHSYTDTWAVTAVADSPTNLWVGTTRGLLRWDVATGRHTVLTTRDGLPADRISAVAVDAQNGVWVSTPKGLVRQRAGTTTWQAVAAPPVGEFLTGLQPTPDGRAMWAGGPEGLAKLKGGKWERYLPDLGVTAIAVAPNGVVWVGTSGRGVLRIPRSNDRVEAYGAAQGCEVDVVRGLAASEHGVLVVGDGPGGPRAAWLDTDRFFSYSVDAPSTIEWAQRSGPHLYLGAGENVWELVPVELSPDGKDKPPEGPVKLLPTQPTTIRGARPVTLKPELPASALDETAANNKFLPSLRPPRFDTIDAGFKLPEGITNIAASDRGLLVGTRFLGAERVENGVVRTFRVNDLAAGAERLTVACKTDEECYLATGGARAWRFDGQAFEPALVDPEVGSRVLAMLTDLKGTVLALHRGGEVKKTLSSLRISTVENANWMPLSMQDVTVPLGPPMLNFSEIAPDGKLWLGLRYTDADKDVVDYGAAEIELDTGKVIYHRQGELDRKTTYGYPLPMDMVAMYWRSAKEAWFATRHGAARLLEGNLKIFTENDGLESELVSDIDGGPGNEVWVATSRGTGRFDGTRWTFPRLGAFFRKASSLAHDAWGHNFIGTDKGLFCLGACDPDAIDTKRGLLEDAVLDLTVDKRGRVWVLSAKGISIVEP